MLVGRKASRMMTATIRCRAPIGINLACTHHFLMGARALGSKANVALPGYDDRIVAAGQQSILCWVYRPMLSIMKAVLGSSLSAIPDLGLQGDMGNVEPFIQHTGSRYAGSFGIGRND